jgi:hypothetical protein
LRRANLRGSKDQCEVLSSTALNVIYELDLAVGCHSKFRFSGHLLPPNAHVQLRSLRGTRHLLKVEQSHSLASRIEPAGSNNARTVLNSDMPGEPEHFGLAATIGIRAEERRRKLSSSSSTDGDVVRNKKKKPLLQATQG